jgi:hypothetical protein
MIRICKVQKGSTWKIVLPVLTGLKLPSRYQGSTPKVPASTKGLTISAMAVPGRSQVFRLTLRADLVHLITSIPQAEQWRGFAFLLFRAIFAQLFLEIGVCWKDNESVVDRLCFRETFNNPNW